jgi:hypothetical protein
MPEMKASKTKKANIQSKVPVRRKGRDYEVEFDRVFLGTVKLEDALVKAGIKHFSVNSKRFTFDGI